MTGSPPPLPREARIGPERIIVICSAAFALLGGLWVSAVAAGWAGWGCAWKSATGLPCASCGATRSVLLLCEGRWFEALLLNPGVLAALVLLAGVAVYAMAVVFCRLEPWRPRVFAGWPWRWMLGAAFAANWLYVVVAGRA